MNQIDILFWLLIVLLGALLLAIEAGAAVRHRRIVLTSVFSVTASVLFMMFLIEDKTFFPTENPEIAAKKKKKGGGGMLDGDEQEGGERQPADGKEGDKKSAEAEVLDSDITDDKLDKLFSDCAGCPLMVRVPAGKFRMGSPREEAGRRPNEGPQRMIGIEQEFAVGRFEISRGEFSQFVQNTGHKPTSNCLAEGRPNARPTWLDPGFEQNSSHPVVCINMDDIKAYLVWLSARAKRPYRLLTEAEWEYTARAGTKSPYATGETLAVGEGNISRRRDGTIAVGLTSTNAFGVSDMHGNAAELVGDCWSETLAELPRDGSLFEGGFSCQRGVVRGGAWLSPPADARSAARAVLDSPGVGSNAVGFRVARDMKLTPPAE